MNSNELLVAGRKAVANGDRVGGIRLFEEGLRDTPGDPDLRMALGRAQMLTDRFEDVTATFHRMLEGDRTNHEAWRPLAEALRYRDRLDEALGAISPTGAEVRPCAPS